MRESGVSHIGRLYVHRRDAAGAWPLEGILTSDQPSRRQFDRVAVAGSWIAGGVGGAVHLFRYGAGLPDPPQPPRISEQNESPTGNVTPAKKSRPSTRMACSVSS